MGDILSGFWSLSEDELFQRVQTTREGLSSEEADGRLARYGRNLLRARRRAGALRLLLRQFQSPIVLILMFAAGLSFVLHDPTDAASSGSGICSWKSR